MEQGIDRAGSVGQVSAQTETISVNTEENNILENEKILESTKIENGGATKRGPFREGVSGES